MTPREVAPNLAGMKIALVCAVVAFALSACVVMDHETYLPDGSRGHSITCSGTGTSWGTCYEKAGEVCGANGYDVIAGGSDQTTVVAGNQYGLYGGSSANRSMLVKCKSTQAVDWRKGVAVQ